MSRLKGADLGVTNPTLTSLGAAKSTIGAGLPALTGRNPGDVHYDSAAKVFYVLTGVLGTAITETFAKTAGSSLVGQTTTTGGKTWIAVNAGGANNSSAVVNADGTGGVAGTGGVFYAAGYAGMPTTGRTLSVDVLTTTAALAAPSAQDTVTLDLGDTSSNTQSTGPITVTIKPTSQTLSVVVDGNYVFNSSSFASLGIATGQTKHTVVVEVRNDKTYAVMVDGITVATGSYTRAIGPVDAFWTTAGTAVTAVEIDNWVDTAQGTLAWTSLVGSGPLNFRGQWTPTASPAYVVNDTALRYGIPYVAMVAPGSIDPVGGITSLAAQTATGGWLGQKTATPFTVSAPIAVSRVQYKIGTGGASTTGGLNVGIATSIGATPTYVAQGSSHGGVAAGGVDTVTFASPVLLVPGTTYYFICDETVIGSTTTPTFTGAIATVGFYTFGTNYATTQSTLYAPFELDGNPWQSLDPATQQMNYRGAYDSTQTYNPNDVVTNNGLLWLALNAAGVAQSPTASYGTVTTASVNASVVAGYENGSIATTGQSNGGSVSAKLTKFVTGQTITINAFAVQIANTGTIAMTVGIATAAPGTADPNGISWFTQNGVQCKASVPGGLVTSGGELAAALPAVFTLPPGTYWFVSTAGSGNTVNTKDVLITGGTLKGAVTSVPDSGHIGTGGSVVNTGETNQGQNFYLSNTANAVNPWASLTSPTESVNTVAASGAAVTLPDVTTATMHRVTLTAATPAITLPAPGAGKSFTVELVQDATGGRAPTWATPSGAIRWPGGAAPTITATANAIDVITFICIGGVNWYGFVAGQAFA